MYFSENMYHVSSWIESNHWPENTWNLQPFNHHSSRDELVMTFIEIFPHDTPIKTISNWLSNIFPIYSGWWIQPLWKILVNWDDFSQYMGKQKMFQTTNQYTYVLHVYMHGSSSATNLSVQGRSWMSIHQKKNGVCPSQNLVGGLNPSEKY